MKRINALHCGLVSIIGMASLPLWAAPPHWDYTEQATWGQLEDPSQTTPPFMYPFAECAIGMHQSPVELGQEARSRRLNLPSNKYGSDTPDFFNSEHTVQVNPSMGYKGVLNIGLEQYPLTQFHFHSPSEHQIGGKSFAGEAHFVHIRMDGRMAVLGVLLEVGPANPTFQTILDNVPTTPSTHNPNTGVRLYPAALLPKDKRHFYTYAGSLTTPPCSEGINWYVLANPITVSADQLAKLQTFYNANNRNPQPLNGRIVTGTVKD